MTDDHVWKTSITVPELDALSAEGNPANFAWVSSDSAGPMIARASASLALRVLIAQACIRVWSVPHGAGMWDRIWLMAVGAEPIPEGVPDPRALRASLDRLRALAKACARWWPDPSFAVDLPEWYRAQGRSKGPVEIVTARIQTLLRRLAYVTEQGRWQAHVESQALVWALEKLADMYPREYAGAVAAIERRAAKSTPD